MSLLSQPEIRQEYGTAKGWRWVIYILMPPLILLFLAMPFLFWKEGQHLGMTIGIAVIALGMALLFLYGLAETIKARHIITTDKLIYQGVFRRKEILLANLKGYRIDEQYTRFYSTNAADPSIRIGYTSERYVAMQQWFAARYPNLVAQELKGLKVPVAEKVLAERPDLLRTRPLGSFACH